MQYKPIDLMVKVQCLAVWSQGFQSGLLPWPLELKLQLKQTTMARTKVYNLRLTEIEWEELVADAESKQVLPAEVIGD